MNSILLESPPLKPEFYTSWKKEMHLWQLAMNILPARRALAVFLSLKGQARTATLEIDVALLHSADGIDKLIKKLDTHSLEDRIQSAFVCNKNFESYQHEPHVSIYDYLIEFE